MSPTRNEDVSNLILLAPIQGWVATLDEVPDPVFADRMMGDGLAIDPTDSTLYAPCDGLIVSSTPHAVTLRADCGAEILVHVGLETVALAGKGFSGQIGQGKRVKARMPLLKFDLEFLAPRVKSLLSPIVVANGEAFAIVRRAENREIKAGEFLMEIAPAAPEVGDGLVSREVSIASTHGLHARPAALLSRRARDFTADIELLREGRRANAKSAVALPWHSFWRRHHTSRPCPIASRQRLLLRRRERPISCPAFVRHRDWPSDPRCVCVPRINRSRKRAAAQR
jgi:phosphocarrier protein FPr/phosphocarrier protein